MKRFLSILLALALALTLGIPALAAEHRAGDTYIRILGSSGARTVGVRTTYGVYRQTADGAVYRDDRYEFVYTGDGEHWTALTPEEQAVLPALRRGRAELNGLQFLLRGGRELWVTDGQGRAVELTADFTSFLASYDMADVQAYPAPRGIRVEVYSRYGYETGASHTYPAAELKQRLAAAQPELLRVTVDGKPVTFPISLYQVSGCTMAPLRQMAQALGYTFDYDGSSGTAVCARGTDTISVRAASTQATVNGKTTNWLAVPAELRGGIFCVPVRFFAEAAGADVTWDAAGQTFYLTTAIQEG